jgi:hypothetical protein
MSQPPELLHTRQGIIGVEAVGDTYCSSLGYNGMQLHEGLSLLGTCFVATADDQRQDQAVRMKYYSNVR